jgi:hypothetical protein
VPASRCWPATVAACRLLAAVALVLAAIHPVVADPIDCARSGTLDDFISRGSEPCGHGRGAYFDFTYSVVPFGGALDVPATAVQVEPISTRYADGLVFTADWRVTRGQSMDVHLAFSFEPVRLAGRGGAGLIVDPWWSPFRLQGTLCLGAGAPCETGSLYQLGEDGALTFPPGLSAGRVEMVFGINGPLSEADGDSAAVTAVSAVLEVAEPRAFVLVGVGLGLGLWRRARALRASASRV